MNNELVYIYEIHHNGSIVYAGKTSYPNKRQSEHRRRWSGCTLKVVRTVADGERWQDAEREVISGLLASGHPLQNKNGGGGGCVDCSSQAEANRNRVISQETRDRMSAAQKGRKHSEETKAKISASGLATASVRGPKIAAAQIGRTYSPETIAKMSASAKARK